MANGNPISIKADPEAFDHMIDLLGNADPQAYRSVLGYAPNRDAETQPSRVSALPLNTMVPFQRMVSAGSPPAGVTPPVAPMRQGILGRPAPATDTETAPQRSLLQRAGSVLGRIGEIAGSALIPNEMKWIPGTTQHGIMEEGLREKKQIADTDVGLKKAETDWREAEAKKAGRDEGGISYPPDYPAGSYVPDPDKPGAFKMVGPKEETPKEDKMVHAYVGADGMEHLIMQKPDNTFYETTSQGKTGEKDKTPSDINQYTSDWLAARGLENTPENRLKAHQAFTNETKTQPGVVRIEALADTRDYNVIDKSTGEMKMVSAREIQRNPDKYAGAAQGAGAMSKEAVFQDINFNVQNVRDAVKNLKTPFDAVTRAQFALALRSPDPKSSIHEFMSGTYAKSLSPDQIDYATALASLMENAMALRGVAGMGQGSDDLRAAILRAIPGPGTPSKDYANRQLDLFEGTVNRLQKGVPGVIKKGENKGQAASEGGSAVGSDEHVRQWLENRKKK